AGSSPAGSVPLAAVDGRTVVTGKTAPRSVQPALGHSRRDAAVAPRGGEVRRGDVDRPQADRATGPQDPSDAAKHRVGRPPRPRFAPSTVWWPPRPLRLAFLITPAALRFLRVRDPRHSRFGQTALDKAPLRGRRARAS